MLPLTDRQQQPPSSWQLLPLRLIPSGAASAALRRCPQELLLGVGGKAAWWSRFEPLLLADDFQGLMAVTRRYMGTLGLPQPDETFINKL